MSDPACDGLLKRLNATAEHLWPELNRLWAQRTTPLGSVLPPEASEGGFSVEVVGEVASTNTALMQRARQGDTAPALMVALSQTAGRGRMGKVWQSAPGSSLTFSVSMPMAPAEWSGLSLAAGVGVVQGLQALQPSLASPTADSAMPLKLKWPNDIWLGQAKLGGILVETAHAGNHRPVVGGVGINLQKVDVPAIGNGDATGLPPMPPAVWQQVVPGMDAASVVQGVAPALVAALLAFERSGFAPFQARFAEWDALAQEPVVLSDGTQGIARGVNAVGELLVEGPQGLRPIHSAEVSIRPRSFLSGRPC